MSKTVLFQTILLSINTISKSKTVLFQTILLSINTISKSKTVLIQENPFSISTLFSSILPTDKTLSGATTPRQNGPVSDGNEGVLRIPSNSSITWTSPSDCFVTYPRHLLWGSYPSVEVQSVYSTAPVKWARFELVSLCPFDNYHYIMGTFEIKHKTRERCKTKRCKTKRILYGSIAHYILAGWSEF